MGKEAYCFLFSFSKRHREGPGVVGARAHLRSSRTGRRRGPGWCPGRSRLVSVEACGGGGVGVWSVEAGGSEKRNALDASASAGGVFVVVVVVMVVVMVVVLVVVVVELVVAVVVREGSGGSPELQASNVACLSNLQLVPRCGRGLRVASWLQLCVCVCARVFWW